MKTRPQLRAYQQVLEYYRGRLSRDDVGLAPLPSRKGGPRPKGLTQAEVEQALPAGSGVVQKIKSGVLRPTPDLLMRLMKLLRVPPDQVRIAHLDLYGSEPVLPAASPSPQWRAVVTSQREMACALTPGGQLTAWNNAFAELFGSRIPANWWEWTLLSEEARGVLLEWDTRWAPSLCTELALLRHRYPDDRGLRDLYDQAIADPRLRELTLSGSGLGDEGRPLRHPRRGEGTAHVMAARTPGDVILTVLFEPAA